MDSDVDQTARGQNNCESGATRCDITLDNTADISATGASEVDADIDQETRGENNCNTGARCDLTLSNTAEVEATGGEEIDADVEQEAKGENNCTTGATCTGTISHSAVITDDATADQSGLVSNTVQGSEDELEIDQKSNQEQNCSGGATCTSSISGEVYYGGGGRHTNKGQSKY